MWTWPWKKERWWLKAQRGHAYTLLSSSLITTAFSYGSRSIDHLGWMRITGPPWHSDDEGWRGAWCSYGVGLSEVLACQRQVLAKIWDVPTDESLRETLDWSRSQYTLFVCSLVSGWLQVLSLWTSSRQKSKIIQMLGCVCFLLSPVHQTLVSTSSLCFFNVCVKCLVLGFVNRRYLFGFFSLYFRG